VSGGKSDGDQPKLDLAEVRRLVNLMETKELAEVEIELEGKRVRVVRAGAGGPVVTAQPAAAPLAAAPAPAAAAAPAAEAAAEPAKRGAEIPSPMVGTFYRSPSPDAAPFAEVGDRIGKESVVCIIEAMKVMNEIKAEMDGEILEILVQNGEPVEFGQPLFLIRPAGSGGA
jgi:acetyl-CoA carboxylase biotin carboxyl carrier protein